MENFIEYMWYLLTTPMKKMKKALNNWYILCRVFGRRFDEAKEDILRARDEGMVATCSHSMLQEHGRERKISRYAGEDYENYRKRIALYSDTCRLAGTNEGVILSVRSLGYNDVSIIPARKVEDNDSVWAEFYVVVSVEGTHPIPFDILCKEVRKSKEVGAKDNYMFCIEKDTSVYAAGTTTVTTYSEFRQEDD